MTQARLPAATIAGADETVIMAHGLWTNAHVLAFQRRWLAALGFRVRAVSYPSWGDGLADNARRLAEAIGDTPGDIIHLVAHSLGGLVALRMLAQMPDPRLRRLVLMGTPCAGGHCVSVALRTPLLAWAVGRTYRDWLRQPSVRLAGAVDVGVIAGTLAIGLGRLLPGLPAPNDGMVAVAETQLAGAKDRIDLPVCHTGMLLSHACTRQIASFLRTGRFAHD